MATIELYSTPLYSDANLVSYYRLEANSNDNKGSNNGSDTTVSYVGAKFNNGAQYNGVTSNSEVVSNFGMTYATSKSLSMWVKMIVEPSVGVTVVLASLLYATNPGNYTAFYYQNELGVYHLFNNSGANYPNYQLGTSVFHHVVLTHDTGGNVTKLYIDGVEGTDGAAGTQDFSSNTTNFTLGGFTVPTLVSPANCIIDDAAIFSRILTPQEISNLYNGTWGSATGFMTANSKFWG
jgi:hypothetical protein